MASTYNIVKMIVEWNSHGTWSHGRPRASWRRSLLDKIKFVEKELSGTPVRINVVVNVKKNHAEQIMIFTAKELEKRETINPSWILKGKTKNALSYNQFKLSMKRFRNQKKLIESHQKT